MATTSSCFWIKKNTELIVSRSPKPPKDHGIKYTTIFIVVLLIGLGDFILGYLLIGIVICCWCFCCRNESWFRKKIRKTGNATGERNLELVVGSPTVSGGVAGAMVVSLDSLRRATNDFDATNIIGKGGSSIVYKGVLDTVTVAVKRMSKQNGISIDSSQFQSEFAALSKIRHRHLVGLLRYCLAENEKIRVLEYMANGSLEDRLH